MAYVNHNGNILPAGQPLFTVNNRWLKMGDAVYEQFRVFDGSMPFLADHVNQLELSLSQLGMEPSRYLTTAFMEKEIDKLLSANNLKNAAITVTVYREGAVHALLPVVNEASYLIEAAPLENSSYEWNKQGIQAGIFREIRHSQNIFASLHTPDQTVQIAAAKWAHQNSRDEAIILNEAGRPVMFSNGDLLVFHHGRLKFPVYSEGAPPSILREYLLPIANRMNIDHQPAEITIAMLEEAAEIMHIHPIGGLSYVSDLEGNEYGQELTKKLFDKLLALLG